MTVEQKSDSALTKDTPYLTFTGELSVVCREYFGESWLH